MKKPKFHANEFSGEGEVTFPDDWNVHHAILRADLLRDWIYDLEKEYNKTVEEICKPARKQLNHHPVKQK